jgi:serine/threonine-protein kinase
VKTLRSRYRLLGPIGRGGSGTVYEAEDLRLPGRVCAVKEVRLAPGDDAERAAAAEALRSEAAMLARLDHPSLPRVSDHFAEDGQLYLVMDFVPGQDLGAVVTDARSRGRWLEEAQVVRWAEDLCAALTYLHQQEPPVVHRDVKPANVKLTPDGRIRLVDFGLAGPAGDGEPHTVTLVAGGGSRAYQPLEQYGTAARVDARADLYALGATLYHLLTGRAPAAAGDRFLDPSALVPVRQLRPDVSAPLSRAIEATMALHPDARPPSAEAVRQLLVSPGGPSSSELADALRQNAWLLLAVITLLLAALAVTMAP